MVIECHEGHLELSTVDDHVGLGSGGCGMSRGHEGQVVTQGLC